MKFSGLRLLPRSHAKVSTDVRFVPKANVSNRSKARQLFDHLVDGGKQQRY